MPPSTPVLDVKVPEHNQLHRLISFLFEPSVIATPFILTIVYTRRHLFHTDLLTVYLLLSLFGAVLPAIYTLTLLKLGKIQSVFYTRRRERLYFYPMLATSLSCVFILFAYTTDSRALVSAAFAALIVAVGLAVLTIWQKISYHLAGLGGELSLAVALVGYWGYILLPVMALVAYSRTRLKEHTWLEVTVGGIYGIVTAALAFNIFSSHGHFFLERLPGMVP